MLTRIDFFNLRHKVCLGHFSQKSINYLTFHKFQSNYLNITGGRFSIVILNKTLALKSCGGKGGNCPLSKR